MKLKPLFFCVFLLSGVAFSQGSKGEMHTTQDTTLLSYKEINLLVDTFGFFVVENRDQLRHLYRDEKKMPDPNKINFSKYVLMGFNTIKNAPEMDMEKKVFDVKPQKEITFDIQFIRKTNSAVGYPQQYWILVKRPSKKSYNYKIVWSDVSQ